MNFDVLLVGDYWYDLIFTGLPGLPALGHELYAGSFDNVPGGAFINAVALQRMGLRVGWAADFGNDPFSRLTLQAAAREGLDDQLFQRHDQPYRRVTAAASFPVDRAFLSYTDPEPQPAAALKALAWAEARVLMIPSFYFVPLFNRAERLARQRRMKIVMDCQFTALSLQTDDILNTLRRVDVFMPNAAEARQLTGSADTLEALKILSELCALVVIKDGANGSYAYCGGEVIHAPAIEVAVVDTTGAGDAFCAGFVRAWLDSRPLAESLRWGNVCGGLSTRAHGGATAAPTLAEVERWLGKSSV